MRPSAPRFWLLAALALLAVLVAIDFAEPNEDAILVTIYAGAPLLAAFGTKPRTTAAVAVLATALALARGIEYDGLDNAQAWVRQATVWLGGLIAVWVSWLRERLERALVRQRFLAGTGELLSSSTDYRETLQQIAQIAVPQIADWCALDLVTPDGGIEGVAVAHVDPDKVQLARAMRERYPLSRDDSGGGAQVLRTGESQLVREVTPEMLGAGAHDEEHRRLLRALELRSGLVVAVRGREHVLGTLTMATTSESRRDLSERDLDLAEDVARRCGLALENATLLERERESRADAEEAHRRAGFLAEASAVMDASLDLERTLDDAARLLMREHALACRIVLTGSDWEPRRLPGAAGDPGSEEVLHQLQQRFPLSLASDAPAGRVMLSGQSLLVSPLDEAGFARLGTGEEEQALMRRLGVRAIAIVALRARGRAHGVMWLGFPEPLRRERDALRFFEDLARRMALAVDNARLYEERSHVARTLQRSLLPPELPAVPGLQLAARYLAAGAGNEVGGDFYDCFATGGSEWALVIGDVCGKGAEAAAITALARYTVRAAVLHTRAPAAVLEQLNEAILRQGLEYRFCTVLYAAVAPEPDGAFTVTLASGGHPLPLVVRAGGRVEPAGEAGTLLGVVPDPDLPERRLRLEPGDALVLYTDGVTEADAEDAASGPARLAGLLARCAGADAMRIASAVEGSVLEGRQDGPRDDVAVLVIRVAPDGGPSFVGMGEGVAATT